eukprot:2646749-Rhodomonas_salina.2
MVAVDNATMPCEIQAGQRHPQHWNWGCFLFGVRVLPVYNRKPMICAIHAPGPVSADHDSIQGDTHI